MNTSGSFWCSSGWPLSFPCTKLNVSHHVVLFTSERVCVVTSVSCPVAFVPPIIDAGTPSDLPSEIDREPMTEKIGSTLRIVQGQSAMIQCSIFAGTGLPIDSVDYTWYYMGMQITNGSKFSITVDDSRRSSTLMVNNFERADNGQFTCVAFNPAGQSQVSTEVFGECYTYMDTRADTHTYTPHTYTPHTHTVTDMCTCAPLTALLKVPPGLCMLELHVSASAWVTRLCLLSV